MQGIKFKMKDGTFDYYDPLQQTDFSETDSEFILSMAYTYNITKENVEHFEWYDLCEECGYELFEGDCRRCITEKELNDLKNEL